MGVSKNRVENPQNGWEKGKTLLPISFTSNFSGGVNLSRLFRCLTMTF